jgi:hypothetical protein
MHNKPMVAVVVGVVLIIISYPQAAVYIPLI